MISFHSKMKNHRTRISTFLFYFLTATYRGNGIVRSLALAFREVRRMGVEQVRVIKKGQS